MKILDLGDKTFSSRSSSFKLYEKRQCQYQVLLVVAGHKKQISKLL